MEASPPKPTKKGKAKSEATVKDRFFDSLLAQVLEQVNLEGLAEEVARLIGPKICQAISVQQLADELAEKHREALSKQLSTTISARLLE
jgi:hypothetical protein